MSDERLSLEGGPTTPDNLVLRQLQGMRREMAAAREQQDRVRQLIVRLDAHMEARFAETKSLIAELKADHVLFENQLLNRHNEVLDILARLDNTDPIQDLEALLARP